MSLQAPVVPAFVRVSQSTLSDEELAYVVDLIKQSEGMDGGSALVPGWSGTTCHRLDTVFREAAAQRGIKAGCRVVTQTVDLRS